MQIDAEFERVHDQIKQNVDQMMVAILLEFQKRDQPTLKALYQKCRDNAVSLPEGSDEQFMAAVQLYGFLKLSHQYGELARLVELEKKSRN
jgi:hypothetical protein